MDRNFTAICAAIDDGDDAALLPLADWLEEQGDPRADALRQTLPRPYVNGLKRAWWTRLRLGSLACIHAQIPCEERRGEGTLVYPTRSAAYLALAEALTEEATHA